MKRIWYVNIVFALIFVSIFILSATTSTAETKGSTESLAANDQAVYEVPEGKQQKWLSLQTQVKKEYKECIEDCGNDGTCLKRCEDVSKVRLNREYKKLMSE